MQKITEKTKNLERRQGIAVSRASNKRHRVSTSSYAWSIQASFYGFGMGRMLNVLLTEFLF